MIWYRKQGKELGQVSFTTEVTGKRQEPSHGQRGKEALDGGHRKPESDSSQIP